MDMKTIKDIVKTIASVLAVAIAPVHLHGSVQYYIVI